MPVLAAGGMVVEGQLVVQIRPYIHIPRQGTVGGDALLR